MLEHPHNFERDGYDATTEQPTDQAVKPILIQVQFTFHILWQLRAILKQQEEKSIGLSK